MYVWDLAVLAQRCYDQVPTHNHESNLLAHEAYSLFWSKLAYWIPQELILVENGLLDTRFWTAFGFTCRYYSAIKIESSIRGKDAMMSLTLLDNGKSSPP